MHMACVCMYGVCTRVCVWYVYVDMCVTVYMCVCMCVYVRKRSGKERWVRIGEVD